MGGANGKPRILLQSRDLRLLEELSILRVVDREQASVVAPFASKTRANARLLALTKAGLLHRAHLGTIAGGRRAIYCRADSPAFIKRLAGGQEYVPTLGLLHQLAVNEVYLGAAYIKSTAGAIAYWRTLEEPIAAAVPLIPDGYFEIVRSDERDSFFLEVDRGTESLGTWATKVRRYLALATTGLFERQFRSHRFGVAVVAHSDRRLAGIQRTIAAQTHRIFWLTTITSIKRDGFWSPIWLRPVGTEKHSLV